MWSNQLTLYTWVIKLNEFIKMNQKLTQCDWWFNSYHNSKIEQKLILMK